jgi:hypothetical protein
MRPNPSDPGRTVSVAIVATRLRAASVRPAIDRRSHCRRLWRPGENAGLSGTQQTGRGGVQRISQRRRMGRRRWLTQARHGMWERRLLLELGETPTPSPSGTRSFHRRRSLKPAISTKPSRSITHSVEMTEERRISRTVKPARGGPHRSTPVARPPEPDRQSRGDSSFTRRARACRRVRARSCRPLRSAARARPPPPHRTMRRAS